MTSNQVAQSYCVGDKTEPLLDTTLGNLLLKAAQDVPDRIALVDAVIDINARRRWTYQQLWLESLKAAKALLTQYSQGDRIAVYAGNSAEWIILQHAASLAGLILVPVNPAYNEIELSAVLTNAKVSGVFYDKIYRGVNLEKRVITVAATLPSIKANFALVDIGNLFTEQAEAIELPVLNCNDILLIQFTSGTTGVPKGACLHHKGVINSSRLVAQRAGFKEGDVWLNAMPMFHVGGSCVTRIGALNYQGTYVLVPGFDVELMLEVIDSEKANITLVVPTMILALLESPNFDKYDVSSIYTLLTGAADVPVALAIRAKKAFGCELSILFGQTETNGVFCQSGVDDSLKDQTETLGRPLPHSEVCVADPDTGNILALGERGEICVKGYQNMAYYYGLEEKTRDTIRANGWLRTGDMGIMDDRGYLTIAGRIKDMIIRGGMNIYPREIEEVLFNHDAVSQVAVIGLPDEKWGEIVAAVVLADDPSAPPSPEELFALCREKLAAHKSPVHWFFVASYPLTPSGKIQKFQLVEQVQDGQLTAQPWQKPASKSR